MRSVALLSACLFASSAWSQNIVWDSTEVSLSPELGAKEAEAVFSFANKGNAAVKIAQVTSSCGCTVPRLEKEVYQPGEKGEIHAHYNIGARQGHNESSVTVLSDDPGASRTVLKLKVDIPMAMEIIPKVVYWNVGQEVSTKSMVIKFHKSIDAKVTSVKALQEGFDVKLSEGPEAGSWSVDVTPTATDQRRRATFVIETDKPVPGMNATAASAFAFIR